MCVCVHVCVSVCVHACVIDTRQTMAILYYVRLLYIHMYVIGMP